MLRIRSPLKTTKGLSCSCSLKQKTKINPVSTRLQSLLTKYRRLLQIWRKTKPPCVRCQLYGIVRRADKSPHHSKGREGLLLIATEWWMALCRPCHRWVHDHPKEAREQGWILPKDF